MSEVLEGSALGKRAFGTEIGNSQRLLQRQAGRHHFANQASHLVVTQGPLVQRFNPLDDLGFTIGSEKIDAVVCPVAEFALNLGDLDRTARTLIEQLE